MLNMQRATTIGASLLRSTRQMCNLKSVSEISRPFSATAVNRLKEIKETQSEGLTVIEGVHVESELNKHLLQPDTDTCLCRLGLDIKYTDVLILRQFIREDGCLLPRRVTGVCSKKQRELAKLVHQAQRAGLLPNFRPELKSGKPRTTILSQYKWKRYNVYYGEND